MYRKKFFSLAFPLLLAACAVFGRQTASAAKTGPTATPTADKVFFDRKASLLTARWNEPFDYESIKSNHAPLGPYLGNGDVGVVSHTTSNSQTLRISKVDFVTDGWSDWAGSGPAALPVGGLTLHIDLPEEKKNFAYAMDQRAAELQMTAGTHEPVRLKSWMSRNENIIVTEITTSSARPVNFTLDTFADSLSDRYATTAAVHHNVAQVTRRTYTKEVRWISQAAISSRIAGVPSVATRSSDYKVQTQFSLRAGQTAYVVAYVSGGGMDDNAHTAEALSRLQKMNSKQVRRLNKERSEWWDEMWARSYVDTHDALLDRQYLSSIYLLASANSPQAPACGGMYGVWNMDDQMMYHGDIHLNYNSQGGFYSLFSANRPELALPFFRFLEKMIPEGQRRAREEMGEVHPSLKGKVCRGILFPVGALGIGVFYNYYWQQTIDAPFNVPLFNWYYKYTGDTAFLREHAYPYLRECGDFYEDFVQREPYGDSYRYTLTTGAHEGSWDLNPPSDLAFVELTFRLLLKYSALLQTDSDRRQKWQDIVDHLPTYKTIQPTRTPNEGKPVFAKNEAGWDLPNHIIQMHPVYPCELIHLRSDSTLLETARNTIYYYSVSQKGFTECMNELGLSAFVMGARTGLAPELLIDNMKQLIAQARPNFLITDGHHCLEKTAVVETVNSMMLQSIEGILHLFPCWPKQPASFTRLRAKGAFLISADYDGQTVQNLTLHSEQGTTCRIRNPWPGQALRVTENGRQIPVSVSEEIGSFPTVAGKTYRIQPATE